jgi:hypothetical protein
MNRYIVKFFKKVLGDNGHEVDACQFALDTLPPDEAAAKERSKREFCAAHRLSHWSVHADRIQVSEAEFPS